MKRGDATAKLADASFTADTAAKTGKPERTIQRDATRAKALGPDLDRVAGTSLDKGIELDPLAGGQAYFANHACPKAPAIWISTPRPETTSPALIIHRLRATSFSRAGMLSTNRPNIPPSTLAPV